jgi:predicted O-methyltransferase YrrM
MHELTTYNDGALDTYLRTHTAGEDEVLRQARERAAQEDMPPIPSEVGAFLSLAVRWTRAQNVLEIGSGAGVSGVWLGRSLGPTGSLTTIEVEPEHRRLALESYREAGIADKVTSLLGKALDVLPTLPDKSFDLIFIDPAKAEYPQYLDHAMRLAVPGGVIIADNILWSGRVAERHAQEPEDVAIRVYNQRISTDPRLHSVILPIGDGVSVSIVIDG